MDYPRFVRLRSPQWDRFEAALGAARDAPGRGGGGLDHEGLEEMALLYRQVLHDLAWARHRFPATAADRRLRRLALAGTRFLVRERPAHRAGPIRFFTRTFPAAFQRHGGVVALTAALFLVIAVFALSVTIFDPALGMLFVGPDAVEGMEEGRLWTESLTTVVPPAVSSSGIATNNLSVALTAWAGGALAGVLTLYILLLNGLMLGSVVGVTMHYSMAPALLEFIAAHGPLEITVILVAAAAGLVLARGMVAAEDRPRSVVLEEAAVDALAILGGCLPWLLLLALVEAFISPSPDFPVVFKVAVGLALEGLFFVLALNRRWLPEARRG